MELPPKNLVEHKLKLDDNERKVYDEVFSFSQQAMLNYMQKQDQDKEDAEYIKKAQEDYYKFDPKVSKIFSRIFILHYAPETFKMWS